VITRNPQRKVLHDWEVGVGQRWRNNQRICESRHCIRIEAAIAGNSMAYDSFGSTASALSGYFVDAWLRKGTTASRTAIGLSMIGQCPLSGSCPPQKCRPTQHCFPR